MEVLKLNAEKCLKLGSLLSMKESFNAARYVWFFTITINNHLRDNSSDEN
jgi:hypothetical protein